MTKKQAPQPPRPGLTPRTVVDAALRLLDDKGLEAVTVRGVADLLGVRMNTVLWHIKSKTRLLELMADAIVGTITCEDLPADPRHRARELMHRYRRALLTHRDGAALVTGTYAAEPHTLRFADTLLRALTDREPAAARAARTLYALVYFTLGLTQEQQAMSETDEDRFREAVTTGPYPALRAALDALAADPFDARFTDGIDRILD
ncbi:TetR/AcrR family transcriptional regulator C-terminal domain-containing protein [Streptomyces flaveus]|uniref:HTH tetR-type domain-containing protein n=1 Tax=Streptomyces flaveus TaxID=66370 RepID=A0A917VFZ1_9ACTN|nr:TetR/AcrR family transcriptional regulator C-terminal domain-containing protein [Streptomyces flaveus]GGK76867.1 hypothetical protein GCM10010094_42600 [Streptomyces flaveus]